MIIVFGTVVVFASVVVFGGRFSHLVEIRFRRPELIVGALLLQIVVINLIPASMPFEAAAAVHLLTYVMGAAFVWCNRRIPGLWILGLGGGLNLAAIATNRGEMPAARGALTMAGLDPTPSGFTNSGAVAHAHLAVLGDIFAVPRSWPLANVFSIGDIVLLVGAAVLLHRVCQSRLTRRRQGSRPSTSTATSAS